MRHLGLVPLLLASASLLRAPALPAQSYRSMAMRVQCRVGSDSPTSRQNAEAWVRKQLQAFLPVTRDQALRMKSLEAEAEQVKLAIYGINSTCEQYRAGKIQEADADLSLSGFEETIANFMHDLSNEAKALAGRGRVTDMPALREAMTNLGGAVRQAALQGEEQLAMDGWHKMTDALVSFSRTFAESCYSQSFDPRIALALERQNQMLGTGIDVTPCANRKFTAEGKGGGMFWRFYHCGQGIGEWKIKTEGPLNGKGLATVQPALSGTWFVDEITPEQDIKVGYSGELNITVKPLEDDASFKVPDQLFIRAEQGTATAEGQVYNKPLNLSGFSFAVKKSDQPCRSNEESE
jgi:hypothetical protein